MSAAIEEDSHAPHGLNERSLSHGIGEDSEIPSIVLEEKRITHDVLADSSPLMDSDFDLVVDSLEVDHVSEKDTIQDEKSNTKDDERKLPKELRWKERTNFTADSPYYTAFCDSEVSNLKVLADTLGDIASRTKTFCRTGVLMSDAMSRLALSCKLRGEDADSDDELNTSDRAEQTTMNKRVAVGDEMAEILELLGEVSFEALSFW